MAERAKLSEGNPFAALPVKRRLSEGNPFATLPQSVVGRQDPVSRETTWREFGAGLAIDTLGIGPQVPLKGIADLANMFGVPGAQSASDFFRRGIQAAEELKPDAYRAQAAIGPTVRDADGNVVGLRAPSAEAFFGNLGASASHIPFMLAGGGALRNLAGAGLRRAGVGDEAADLAGTALGYGGINAALVAPSAADDVRREAYDEALARETAEAALEHGTVTPELRAQAEQAASEEARAAQMRALAMVAPLTAVTGAIPGVIATRGGQAADSMLGAIFRGGAAETPFEFAEEAGTSAASDIALGRDVDVANALDAGLLAVASGAAQGGALGGLEHATRQRSDAPVDAQVVDAQEPEAAPVAPAPPPRPAVDTPVDPVPEDELANDIMDALVAAGIVPPSTPEQGASPEPVAPAAGSQPAAAVPDLAEQFAQPDEAPVNPPAAERAASNASVTMQNRDRARAASVAQMQTIRKNPEPERLSFSRDPNTGAPMVSEGRPVPADDRGRSDVVLMASGRRVPVTYAVVEASELAASHDADGRANPAYETAPLRALNNGRVAGLQAAHSSGNARGYVDGIVADAAVHGVNESAIRNKRQPVLVRLYDPAANAGDMGAESNASAQLGLSPVEQAQTDARALPDMTALEWSEDGGLSPSANASFYRAWFNALGSTAASSLQDASGRPNAAAVTRIRAAMMHKAYGNDAILTALSEEISPDNRNVLNAMAQAAPAFASLDAGGPLTTDVTEALTGAFAILRDAASRRMTVAEFVAQTDAFGRNEAAEAIALFMADNARSSKRMAEAFKAMAAYADARQRAEAVVDIFGTAETPSILGAINAAHAALEDLIRHEAQPCAA